MSTEEVRPKARAVSLQRDVEPMKALKPAFHKSYEKAKRALGRNLDRLVQGPDEDSVHDARTAIRRIDALLSVFPKAIRKSPEVKDLRERQRRVMKITAKVRDLDIIREKVSRYGGSTELMAGIEKRRRKAAAKAQKAGASARKAAAPSAAAKEVTQARLDKRFRKVAMRLAGKIEWLAPVVAADPRKLGELHSLRINCKKLRYTLELALEGEAEEALALLQRWQDALGSIHDWDVTTAYLEKSDDPSASKILEMGFAERATEFRDFSRSVLGEKGSSGSTTSR